MFQKAKDVVMTIGSSMIQKSKTLYTGFINKVRDTAQKVKNAAVSSWRSVKAHCVAFVYVTPVSQTVIDNAPVKQSLSMLSESVDWSQVAACVSSKSNCICYGHSAQRLNIVPDTCNAAINYGWIVPKKM